MSRRYATSKRIALNPAVEDRAITSGRKATPMMIQRKSKKEEISTTYMCYAHTFKKLKLELFGIDIELKIRGPKPSYIS